MKKILFLSICVLFFSCDDGDLQIERIDFQESTIETCGDKDDFLTTFFFKINQDEALLLNLASGLIKNETSTAGTLKSTLPSASSLIYRLFSDNVSQAYFCDAIPPLEPTVLKENTATAGNLAIDTKVGSVTKDNKNYAHTISITDLSLVNDQEEQLTDLSTFVYGDFTTTTANSAKLATPFSNYADIPAVTCTASPIDGSLRLYKIAIDEFIALDIPMASNLFENAATDSEPRTLDLAGAEIFKYVVLDTLVTSDLACSSTFTEDITNWNYVSTAGTVKVETVEKAPDANGKLSYTHSITLEKLNLTLKGDGAEVKDVAVGEIGTVDFGTYETTED